MRRLRDLFELAVCLIAAEAAIGAPLIFALNLARVEDLS